MINIQLENLTRYSVNTQERITIYSDKFSFEDFLDKLPHYYEDIFCLDKEDSQVGKQSRLSRFSAMFKRSVATFKNMVFDLKAALSSQVYGYRFMTGGCQRQCFKGGFTSPKAALIQAQKDFPQCVCTTTEYLDQSIRFVQEIIKPDSNGKIFYFELYRKVKNQDRLFVDFLTPEAFYQRMLTKTTKQFAFKVQTEELFVDYYFVNVLELEGEAAYKAAIENITWFKRFVETNRRNTLGIHRN